MNIPLSVPRSTVGEAISTLGIDPTGVMRLEMDFSRDVITVVHMRHIGHTLPGAVTATTEIEIDRSERD